VLPSPSGRNSSNSGARALSTSGGRALTAPAGDTLRRYAEDAGRDPATLRNVSQVPICVADSYEEAKRRADEFVAGYFDVPEWSDASADSAICGTVEQCAEQAAAHLEAGVQELVFMPYEYRLEQIEAIGKERLPRLRDVAVGSPA
jgi:alkanesulfonate monooxygenase